MAREVPSLGTEDPPGKPAAEHSRGERIGGYELIELIGRGGAATVYSARRVGDGAIVALKVLSAERLAKPRIVQRFRDEARTAASVHHPTLVGFLELVEQSSPPRLAYAMELVRGISLRERIERHGALPLQEATHVARQICLGVEALHAAGVVHRDLKPENVMLVAPEAPGPPWQVKILDFGVVKRLDGTRSEAVGSFVGTPRYMAPEQAAGGDVDVRSDFFAIGVILFEMITGVRPHEGESLKAVVMAKLKGAPRLLTSPDQEILPLELADAVDACLKLQPDLRPKDARSLIRILEEVETVLGVVGPVRLDPERGFVRAASTQRSDEPPPPESSALTPLPSSEPPQTGSEDLALAAADVARTRFFAQLLLVAVAVAGAVTTFSLVLGLADRAGEVVVQVAPTPPPERLQIVSVPAGAMVELGGRVMGPTPRFIEASTASVGTTIRLSHPGYRSATVAVPRGTTDTVLISLEREAPQAATGTLAPGAAELPAHARSPH